MDKRELIFIVEDDPGFNMMITSYLKAKDKWEIHSFESGEACLEQLALKPTIFLQDFDLPGMNGIEVMKQVKHKLPDTEFIFMSAQTDIKVAIDALKNGAFDYVMKDSNTKESTLNKIDQVLLIKKLVKEGQDEKRSKRILAIIFLSFVVIVILVWGSGILR